VILLRGRATRWLADDPQPGLVEIEFDDADGRTHRFVEKSAVIDAADAVHAGAEYPVAIEIACRPHNQRRRSFTDPPINAIDLSPWGIGEEGVLYSVKREALTWGPPARYSDLSVAARQAVALVTFRRWRAAIGLQASELDALEEHLWEHASVGPDTFDAWYESHPLPELDWPDPLPAPLAGAIEAAGLNPADVRPALDALTEITYGGLFSGIESRRSLDELETVIEFARRYDITHAPADAFTDSLWIDHDWGRPSDTVISKWRAIE
jgi:hypothetical protein